jgi:hypothetical protein
MRYQLTDAEWAAIEPIATAIRPYQVRLPLKRSILL